MSFSWEDSYLLLDFHCAFRYSFKCAYVGEQYFVEIMFSIYIHRKVLAFVRSKKKPF